MRGCVVPLAKNVVAFHISAELRKHSCGNIKIETREDALRDSAGYGQDVAKILQPAELRLNVIGQIIYQLSGAAIQAICDVSVISVGYLRPVR